MTKPSATPVLETPDPPKIIQVPPLFVWQSEVRQALTKYRFVVISSARQIGKTMLAVLMAMDTAMQGGTVWWIAPNYKLTNPGYDLLRKYTQQQPFKQFVTEYKQRRHFTFKNADRVGTIEIISADDPTQVVGATLDLAVIDEAARMHQDAWYEGVYSTLTVKRGKALLISNPRGKNWFWELWRRGDPSAPEHDSDYYSRSFSQYDNPLVTPEDIERQRAQMPARKFQREVLGEFTDDGGEVFVGVRKAATILPHLPPLGIYDPSHTYVGGMDLSAGRQDYSVILITDVTVMAQVAMYRFSTPSLPEHIRILKEVNDYWHPEVIEVEENAQAMFVVPEFEAIGLPVRAWNANWKSKRELIENYAAAIELERLRLLNDATLVKEHEAMESNVTANGHVQYNAPKGQNDDTVTAGALSYRAGTVRESISANHLYFLPFRGLYGASRRRERRTYR